MNRSPSTSSFSFWIESSRSPASRVAFHSRSPDRVLMTPSIVACVVAISLPISILLRSRELPPSPFTHEAGSGSGGRRGLELGDDVRSGERTEVSGARDGGAEAGELEDGGVSL